MFLLISFKIRETSFLTAHVMTMHGEVPVTQSNEAGVLKEQAGRERWRRASVYKRKYTEKETLQILMVNSEQWVHK